MFSHDDRSTLTLIQTFNEQQTVNILEAIFATENRFNMEMLKYKLSLIVVVAA